MNIDNIFDKYFLDEHQGVVAEKKALLVELETLQATNHTAQDNVDSLNLAKEDLETKLLETLSEHKQFKEQVESTNDEFKMTLKAVETKLEVRVHKHINYVIAVYGLC